MRPFRIEGQRKYMAAALLECLLTIPAASFAKSPVKMVKLDGIADVSSDGPAPYQLEGVASHLGRYEAYGEVTFLPGDDEGSLVGTGPVVFEAANGDLLVGTATWEIGPETDGVSDAHIHFAWQDAVEFDDGTTVFNTGHFVDNRPPGLIIDPKIFSNPIILILIIVLG